MAVLSDSSDDVLALFRINVSSMPPPSSNLMVYSLKEWNICCNHVVAIIVLDT
jgi:hypothetical protein